MRVYTDSILATRVCVATLIDVITSHKGIAIISLPTLAHLASIVVSGTLSIGPTLAWHTDCHISGGGTGLVWIATKPGVTLALVGNIVDTVTVTATPWCTDCR